MTSILVMGSPDVDLQIKYFLSLPLFQNNTLVCDNNVTKSQVRKFLKLSNDDVIFIYGHGTPNGLLNSQQNSLLIDSSLVNLLRDKIVIGQWCYASTFADVYGLKGFFSSMFISNANDAKICLDLDVSDNDVFHFDDLFSKSLVDLIYNRINDIQDWSKILIDNNRDDFMNNKIVNFNYSGLMYFDGSTRHKGRKGKYMSFRNSCG